MTPLIWWASTPVGPNETCVVAGVLPPAPLVHLSVLQGSGHTHELVLQPEQTSATSLKFVLPASLPLATYGVRVCSAGGATTCSNDLTLNEVDPWWWNGDKGNASSAGGWLRVFGANFDFRGWGKASAASTALLLEERLRHAVQSRDAPSISALAQELAQVRQPRARTAEGVALPQLALRPALEPDGAPVAVLNATNASMWDAHFALPPQLAPGRYAVSLRNALQANWTRVTALFGSRDEPRVDAITVVPPRPAPPRSYLVADFLGKYAIPRGGQNFSSGAPVNGTQAVLDALAAARAGGGGVVVLPPGKTFVDGPLDIPPHTTLRGQSRDTSALYFLEDGIGTQLGGLPLERGGSPTPDPAYLYCNCTEPWGLEQLSIYVTSFSNNVVYVAPGSSGFVMRHVLIREAPYFGLGYGSIVAGGSNGVGGGAPPAVPLRDAATQQALNGHAHRIANWTYGSLAIGATVWLMGSNAEVTDCDITCTKWCIKVSNDAPWFPLGGDAPLVHGGGDPHHVRITRNRLHNADVAIHADFASKSIVEHNEILGSVLGGGAIYPPKSYHLYVGSNSNRNHWSYDREAYTLDNPGTFYYGPVARYEGGAVPKLTVPADRPQGGPVPPRACLLVVLNGTGFGSLTPVVAYDVATHTYTLAAPLPVAPGAGSFVQVTDLTGYSIFHANHFEDHGAFQFYGTAVAMVVAENTGRRMGGFVSWGQWHARTVNGTTLSGVEGLLPNVRQLWADNAVLDENGVRNYMAAAAHTPAGARLRNESCVAPAQQAPRVMGALQFNGYSFGVEGGSVHTRPDDAPPINSFLIWRRNQVIGNGGFGLAAAAATTPGEQAHAADGQPRMAELLLEHNVVRQSAAPFSVAAGMAGGLMLRGNSFAPEL